MVRLPRGTHGGVGGAMSVAHGVLAESGLSVSEKLPGKSGHAMGAGLMSAFDLWQTHVLQPHHSSVCRSVGLEQGLLLPPGSGVGMGCPGFHRPSRLSMLGISESITGSGLPSL